MIDSNCKQRSAFFTTLDVGGIEEDKSTVLTIIFTAGLRTTSSLQHLLLIPNPNHPQPLKKMTTGLKK